MFTSRSLEFCTSKVCNAFGSPLTSSYNLGALIQGIFLMLYPYVEGYLTNLKTPSCPKSLNLSRVVFGCNPCPNNYGPTCFPIPKVHRVANSRQNLGFWSLKVCSKMAFWQNHLPLKSIVVLNSSYRRVSCPLHFRSCLSVWFSSMP